MKYRILTMEELEVFEEDFKQFLIVNGVHTEEWEEMNKSDKDNAVKMVELGVDRIGTSSSKEIVRKEINLNSEYLDFSQNKWYNIKRTSGEGGWVLVKFIKK